MDRSIGLVFFNSSLRTRTSMELAARQLGAHSTTVNIGNGVWGMEHRDGVVMDGDRAEHVTEAFGVLSRYYDALGVRVFAQFEDKSADQSDAIYRSIQSASNVPLLNLESAMYHPCQALADATTIADRFEGATRGRRFVLAWTHHPRGLPTAVPNSALLMAARLGMDVTVACPDEFALSAGIMQEASRLARASGGSVCHIADLDASLEGADVVYAKSWSSELRYEDPVAEQSLRSEYQYMRVTSDRMAMTNGAAFMHCLPVRRGVVVDDAVLDGPNAVHLDEAENRLHAQKAILEYLWDLPTSS